jgi:hypothetical protein
MIVPKPLSTRLAIACARNSLIAIVRQHHHCAGRELIEHRGDAGHARAERHRFARLQPADDIFERLPCRRAVIARVLATAANGEVRGGNEWDVQWITGLQRAARRHEPRLDFEREWVLLHAFEYLPREEPFNDTNSWCGAIRPEKRTAKSPTP